MELWADWQYDKILFAEDCRNLDRSLCIILGGAIILRSAAVGSTFVLIGT